MSNAELMAYIAAKLQTILAQTRDLDGALSGRKVRIVKPWRDQAFGKTKPDVNGREYTVDFTVVSRMGNSYFLLLFLHGFNYGVPYETVEFLS